MTNNIFLSPPTPPTPGPAPGGNITPSKSSNRWKTNTNSKTPDSQVLNEGSRRLDDNSSSGISSDGGPNFGMVAKNKQPTGKGTYRN